MARWLESLGLFWRPPDLRSRREVDDEIADELEFHVAMRAAELERDGLAPDRARVEAERRFGDRARVAKACRRAQIGERVMLQRVQAVLLVGLIAAVGWLAWEGRASDRASAAALAEMTRQMGLLERRLALDPELLASDAVGAREGAGGPEHADSPRADRREETSGKAAHAAGSADAAAPPTVESRAAALLARLNAEKDWRPAITIGDEIAALPPDEGLAVLRSMWP